MFFFFFEIICNYDIFKPPTQNYIKCSHRLGLLRFYIFTQGNKFEESANYLWLVFRSSYSWRLRTPYGLHLRIPKAGRSLPPVAPGGRDARAARNSNDSFSRIFSRTVVFRKVCHERFSFTKVWVEFYHS